MDVPHERRRRLAAIASWAEESRQILGPVLEAHGARVHFRPSATGVAMVGLLPSAPQRGKGGFTRLHLLAQEFEDRFARHCQDVEQGRYTGEKELQSFLIAEANQHRRRLASINAASSQTDDPVELLFVTDEVSLPVAGGKVVCDLLALRVDGGACTPVLIELKDARLLRRLVEQVSSFSALMDEHVDGFEALYGAVLGRAVRFDGPTERWIVWPSAGPGDDPRAGTLAEQRVRVVGYEVTGGRYAFHVGPAPPRG